jgi:hypothetical protein
MELMKKECSIMEDSHDNQDRGTVPDPVSEARAAPASGSQPGSAQRRAKRIEEYLQDSLEKEDPLQASLGAGTADLMHIRSKLAESIKAELGPGPVTLEEYRKDFAPAVSSLVLLDRHILSYARLGHDLKRAESSTAAEPHRHGTQADHGKRS